MALGKITSLLSSLSPASDAAAAPTEEMPQDLGRQTEALSDQSGLANDSRRGPSSDIAAQLQTMVGAVRILNENALQQGAAVAVSQVGGELKNAVSGLGHLLSAVSLQALANGAAAPAREAGKVIDGVEAGLAGSQAAAEQLIRNLPAVQSQRAQEASDKFQAEMRTAISQVRGALGSLNVRS